MEFLYRYLSCGGGISRLCFVHKLCSAKIAKLKSVERKLLHIKILMLNTVNSTDCKIA